MYFGCRGIEKSYRFFGRCAKTKWDLVLIFFQIYIELYFQSVNFRPSLVCVVFLQHAQDHEAEPRDRGCVFGGDQEEAQPEAGGPQRAARGGRQVS